MQQNTSWYVRTIKPHKSTGVYPFRDGCFKGNTVVWLEVYNPNHPIYDPSMAELGLLLEEAPNRKPILLPGNFTHQQIYDSFKGATFRIEMQYDDDGDYYQIVASADFGDLGVHEYILRTESQPNYFCGRDLDTVKSLFAVNNEKKFLREIKEREEIRHKNELMSYKLAA